MGAIDKAVSWALEIATDDSHGYDQGGRWGPDYDCSSLVIQAYENAGVKVKTAGATYTGNMVNIFKSCGFQDVTGSITLSTGDGLQKGDVLWKSGHTEMVSRTGYIVGAWGNENGEATGGEIGDQTGKEIRERVYYNGPWSIVLRYPENQETIEPISNNRYLTQTEMETNAQYIWNYLGGRGWSINAVAGMLGNMQTESTINPGIWQGLNEGTGPGFGLVQWTPYTKYTDWCKERNLDPADMDSALQRIEYELENGLQYYKTKSYPISFADFKASTESPYYLGMAFLANYERPAVSYQPKRGKQAEMWYEYLSGLPAPGYESKRKGLPLFMMYMTSRRKV